MVKLRRDRAVAETGAALETRIVVDGIDTGLTSYSRTTSHRVAVMSAEREASWPGEVDEHIAPHMAAVALLIIDTQVDFVDGGASPIYGTSVVLPALSKLREAFLSAGRPVVHVIRLYEGDDVDRVRRTAMADGIPIVSPETQGSLVVPELCEPDMPAPDARRLLAGELEHVGPDEVVMWKPRWSAFHRTNLHRHLSALRIDTVVIAGCNFPNCPRATIYDASEHDYRVLVPADAVSGIKPWHLDELAKIGVLHATAEDIAWSVSNLSLKPSP